jgi:hypothetical protein
MADDAGMESGAEQNRVLHLSSTERVLVGLDLRPEK